MQENKASAKKTERTQEEMRMNILVTYKSKTGFTKKYAEIVAKEVGCEAVDFKKTSAKQMSEYDVVVFGSRLHAGMIDGLKKAKEMFAKSGAKKLVVFVTGATPNEAAEEIETVWKNNLTAEELESIPHFYMQSGLCYEKMSFGDKSMMKMVSTVMSKQKDLSSKDQRFLQAIQSSYDISSEEYAKPLIAYLKGENVL